MNDEGKLNEVVGLVFSEFDKDNSGNISKGELTAAVNAFNSGAELDACTEEQINSAFSALDTNNDGEISKDEFKALVVDILKSM